jgi:hypothetical protein
MSNLLIMLWRAIGPYLRRRHLNREEEALYQYTFWRLVLLLICIGVVIYTGPFGLFLIGLVWILRKHNN